MKAKKIKKLQFKVKLIYFQIHTKRTPTFYFNHKIRMQNTLKWTPILQNQSISTHKNHQQIQYIKNSEILKTDGSFRRLTCKRFGEGSKQSSRILNFALRILRLEQKNLHKKKGLIGESEL